MIEKTWEREHASILQLELSSVSVKIILSVYLPSPVRRDAEKVPPKLCTEYVPLLWGSCQPPYWPLTRAFISASTLLQLVAAVVVICIPHATPSGAAVDGHSMSFDDAISSLRAVVLGSCLRNHSVRATIALSRSATEVKLAEMLWSSRCTLPFAPSAQTSTRSIDLSLDADGQTSESLAHVVVCTPVAGLHLSLKLENGMVTSVKSVPAGTENGALKQPRLSGMLPPPAHAYDGESVPEANETRNPV
mmetsp:Transcript_45879/g.135593  ORF Transcript_45879/g.135593 Transcript_45879/m.135593 type:complete len:248 (+) Transcript_45879:361-1104(+)